MRRPLGNLGSWSRGLGWSLVLSIGVASTSRAEEDSPSTQLVELVAPETPRALAWTALTTPQLISDRQVRLLQSAAARSAPEQVWVLHGLFAVKARAVHRDLVQSYQSLLFPSNSVSEGRTQINRVRATSMRALARLDDTQALTQLLAISYSENVHDTWGAAAARSALSDLPDLQERIEAISPMLEARRAMQRLGLDAVALPGVPTLARQARRHPEKLQATLAAIVAALRAPVPLEAPIKRWKPQFTSEDQWSLALAAEPLWTLRIAALLRVHLPRRTVHHLETAARSYLGKQPLLDAAARWVLRPAGHIPLRRDQTEVGESRGTWSLEKWAAQSTHALWRGYAEGATPSLVAALCARFENGRFSHDTRELGPETNQLRLWLTSSDANTRAACAYGLSRTRPDAALPLLVSRYFEEHADEVRTALVHALTQYLRRGHPLLQSIAALDPDQRSRDLASFQYRDLGFAIAIGAAQMTVLTTTGKSYVVSPSSDGFSGYIDPDR